MPNIESIQAVFRGAGLFAHAADTLLCEQLAAAALPRDTVAQRLRTFLHSRGLIMSEPFIDAAADAIAGGQHG